MPNPMMLLQMLYALLREPDITVPLGGFLVSLLLVLGMATYTETTSFTAWLGAFCILLFNAFAHGYTLYRHLSETTFEFDVE